MGRRGQNRVMGSFGRMIVRGATARRVRHLHFGVPGCEAQDRHPWPGRDQQQHRDEQSSFTSERSNQTIMLSNAGNYEELASIRRTESQAILIDVNHRFVVSLSLDCSRNTGSRAVFMPLGILNQAKDCGAQCLSGFGVFGPDAGSSGSLMNSAGRSPVSVFSHATMEAVSSGCNCLPS